MSNEIVMDAARELLEEIFDLLKRRGPLCVSQISVELLLPPKKVKDGLNNLKKRGLVALRPDRDAALNNDDDLKPWGLTRKLWK